MKNAYLYVALLWCPLTSFTQEYLDASSMWYFKGTSFDEVSTSGVYHRYYYFAGDSIVGAKTYHKLFMDRYDTLYNFITEVTTPQVFLHQPVGLMREESGALYKRAIGSSEDTLTFDFTQYAPGAIIYNDDEFCGGDLTVTSMDSVYLGTELRHRYFLDDHPMHWVVEGVGGGTGGFTLGCPGEIPMGNSIYPVCYSMNGYSIGLGSNENGICDEIPAEVMELTLGEVVIFPNPTGGMCRLQNLGSNTKLRLFNMQGENCPVRIFGETMDLSPLTAGIYILQIQTLHGMSVQRIIKM